MKPSWIKTMLALLKALVALKWNKKLLLSVSPMMRMRQMRVSLSLMMTTIMWPPIVVSRMRIILMLMETLSMQVLVEMICLRLRPIVAAVLLVMMVTSRPMLAAVPVVMIVILRAILTVVLVVMILILGPMLMTVVMVLGTIVPVLQKRMRIPA